MSFTVSRQNLPFTANCFSICENVSETWNNELEYAKALHPQDCLLFQHQSPRGLQQTSWSPSFVLLEINTRFSLNIQSLKQGEGEVANQFMNIWIQLRSSRNTVILIASITLAAVLGDSMGTALCYHDNLSTLQDLPDSSEYKEAYTHYLVMPTWSGPVQSLFCSSKYQKLDIPLVFTCY